MLSGPRETILRARKLRRSMSLPEVLLWRELRKRPKGLKFRRQQAASRYVTDFYCHSANLAVEIDGEAHSRGNAPEWDARRDRELNRQGVRTLRIPAYEVLDNLEGVVQAIIIKAGERITPPPSYGRSPSPEGEDF
jgi:very-short-patch-repair endonuclease